MAAIVTVPPRTPAQIIVVLAPKASASGPTAANDSGTPPIVIIQSRLDTRPKSSDGTRRCRIVNQMMTTPAIEASATKPKSIASQRWVTTPKPPVQTIAAPHAR